jgi:hypothetical protein
LNQIHGITDTFVMNNARTMQLSFEKEKNIKASIITLLICLLMFMTFFFLQWTLPQIPIPETGEGIEVNLGNSEIGLGDIAPETPGQPSPTQDQTNPSTPPSNQPVNTKEIQADETGDEAVNLAKKSSTKPVEKTTVETKPTLKKTETVATPVVAPPKPKALFKGGTSSNSSGNNADSYNGVKNQGIAGGKGDQGNPNGNPNSDSYQGNAASGNSGAGNGVSIRSGLDGRRITKLPSFEDDFNENAKVAVNITVDQNGNVMAASINPKGTTTTNQTIRNIALKKAKTLKLNAGKDSEQEGTLVFSFKLRG